MSAGGQSMNAMNFCEAEVKTAGGIIDNSGCTVEGSYSGQQFRSVDFRVSNKPAVVLQMVLKGAAETTVQSISSSLKKDRTDKVRRQQIADLEKQMAAMQDMLERLKNQ